MTMEAKQIEVWLDETSDPSDPAWCVSLCAGDGEEIRCLATYEDRARAMKVGADEASRRGLACIERNTDGSTEEVVA